MGRGRRRRRPRLDRPPRGSRGRRAAPVVVPSARQGGHGGAMTRTAHAAPAALTHGAAGAPGRTRPGIEQPRVAGLSRLSVVRGATAVWRWQAVHSRLVDGLLAGVVFGGAV